MQERRRKFYGWGYEDDSISPEEISEFESAWSRLLGVDKFVAIPFPKADEISLRAPRVQPPASLSEICTTDHYDRLYHTYGAGTVDVARSLRKEFHIRRMSSHTQGPNKISSIFSTGVAGKTLR
jgi:alkyldihydroxyacetonephosphate synthase